MEQNAVVRSIYHDEGFQDGRKDGKLEGKIEVVINAIQTGFDNSVIAQLTGLSTEEIQEIRKNT